MYVPGNWSCQALLMLHSLVCIIMVLVVPLFTAVYFKEDIEPLATYLVTISTNASAFFICHLIDSKIALLPYWSEMLLNMAFCILKT